MDEAFTDKHKIVQAVTVVNGAAAATSITGETIDMQGFEHVTFIVQTGPIVGGATTSLKVQRDTVSTMAAAADIAGTSVVVNDDDDNQVKYINVLRPGERYVRLIVTRGVAAATVAALAVLYGARNRPATQPTGVEGETHKDKAEGTA